MAKQTYLIIKASCNEEFVDPQPDYVIFPITRQDVRDLIAKIKRVKRFTEEEDANVWRISFWDCRPIWLSSLPWSDKKRRAWPTDLITGRNLADIVDSNDFIFAMVKINEIDRSGDELEDHTVRADCVTLHASKDAADWRGYIKHSDAHISTHDIGLDDLQTILKTLSKRKPA